ncbi:PREDICTED: vasorin-like [Branchiostoma belcheri]|uniref:Vasorin-like n=1 Tax=Branchiostoma belcheri TaxID=7741 RepID=A0A6P5A745_BRABE|nr:PREDICTED: vasorin-like [Branchiostoma belcheri]
MRWVGVRGFQYGILSSKTLAIIDPSLLVNLFLIEAGITELSNDTFKDFHRLQSLQLDYNLLRHIPRNWYSASRSGYPVDKLSISHNNITSLDAECFKNMNLTSLDLRSNALRELRSEWFIGIENLKTLLLSGNRIKTIQPNIFRSISQLHFLDLSHNDLVCLDPGCFKINMHHLSLLDLRSNVLREVRSAWFIGLENLRTLLLSGNKIKRVPSNAFESTIHLQFLDLSHNDLQKKEKTPLFQVNVWKHGKGLVVYTWI